MSKETEPKGEYEFTLPDFDEDTFIHREMVSFRTTTILFVWGIVAAAVSWAAFHSVGGDTNTGWLLGILLATAFGFSLKFLFPRLGADVAHWKRREWLGTAFLFVFTWLSFFMIAVNPPVSDYAAPEVLLSADPPTQLPNGTVSLAMLVTDNASVRDQALMVDPPDGEPYAPAETGRSGDLRYFNLTGLAAGRHVVTATGTDGGGRVTTRILNVTVEASEFKVVLPDDGTLGRTDSVVVTLKGFPACDGESYGRKPCIRAMRLRLEGGGEVVLDRDEARPGDWKADVNSKGWREGVNVFGAEAEFLNSYLGSHPVPGGRIVLPGPFTLNVTEQPGDHVPEVPPTITGRALNVPGYQVAALVAVLGGAALVARRRGA